MVAPRLGARWLLSLRARDLRPLVASFDEDCVLQVAGDPQLRTGTGQLAGWLRGQVLAWPYRDVRPVFLAPSARPGVDLVMLDLVDACDVPLARLTAKLHQGEDGYVQAHFELQRRKPPPACPF